MKIKQLLTLSALSSALLLNSAAIFADEHAKEVAELKERIAKLEEAAVTSDKKGGLKIGDTTLKIGGYVKLDLHYVNNGVNTFQNGLIIPQLSASANDDGQDRVDLTARESRFYIKTSTPFGGKPLNTTIEVDFYGSDGTETVSNSHGLRLRHAYGQWGNVLMGQTWTTFMDLNHIPELNAFGLHASSIFARQAQIRYTQPMGSAKLMLAIENPEDGGDDQKRPDLIARVDFDGKWGHASVAAVNKELNNGNEETASATAYSLTARIPTIGKDDVRLQYNNGDLGRYMSLGTFPNSIETADSIDGFEATGYSVAYRRVWNSKWRSSLVYSKIEADDTPAANAITSVESKQINLMWQANPKLRYGIEYAQWEGEQQGVAGSKDFDVVQLSARYLF